MLRWRAAGRARQVCGVVPACLGSAACCGKQLALKQTCTPTCCPRLPTPKSLFSVAIFIGPAAGASLAPLTAALGALGAVGVCALYTLLILPESLSPEAKAAVSR